MIQVKANRKRRRSDTGGKEGKRWRDETGMEENEIEYDPHCGSLCSPCTVWGLDLAKE